MEKKKSYTKWIILGVVVLLALWFFGSYNGLVKLDTAAEAKWGNVQNSYQRRADLVPNLVAIVKSYSNYEGDVLTEITNARASVGQAKNAAELEQAGTQLNSALSRLLVVVEAYPNLKASENYLALQAQLEGAENRINTERTYYNTAVQQYKQKVRSFPSNMVAGMFGFSVDKWDMFQAAAGAEKAPDVKGLIA